MIAKEDYDTVQRTQHQKKSEFQAQFATTWLHDPWRTQVWMYTQDDSRWFSGVASTYIVKKLLSFHFSDYVQESLSLVLI